LTVSLVDAFKIIVFAVSFLQPHAIRPIFVIVPGMLLMVSGVLVMAIIFSFSELFVAMLVGQCPRRYDDNWSAEGLLPPRSGQIYSLPRWGRVRIRVFMFSILPSLTNFPPSFF